MYVEACSSAVLKENPEYVMFMKMKLLVKQQRVGNVVRER